MGHPKPIAAVVAIAVLLGALALGPAGTPLGPDADALDTSAWQWYQADMHAHSVVGSDGLVDYGILAESYQSRGYDAVFVTDHQGGSSFSIGEATANNATLDDDYERFDDEQIGDLSTFTNEFVTSPANTGTGALHLQAASPSSGVNYVVRERGPTLRSGDLTVNVSVYPTRIDPGSGLSFSLAIGGDPTETAEGYTTVDGAVSPGKHTILVWQLGDAAAASSDPEARVITTELEYTLNEWNDYSIDVTAALAQIPDEDQPLDYNAVTFLKLSASANNGSAEGYFDTYSLVPADPVSPADEFAFRETVIDDFDTDSFRLFPSIEMGIDRHASRFDKSVRTADDYGLEHPQGVAGIPDTHASGYPAQLNHPGRPGGVSVEEAVANLAYGADMMEAREDNGNLVMIETWDAILQTGTQLLGTWGSDAHEEDRLDTSYRGVATNIYASSLELDPLMRSLYEGRTYMARNTFDGRVLFGINPQGDTPFAARYPVFVSTEADTSDLRLSIDGGIPPGATVEWIQDGSSIATDVVAGSSYGATKAIGLDGVATYVRAELRDADGSRIAMTQPIWIMPSGNSAPGMRLHTETIDTEDGRGYTNESAKGVISTTWDPRALRLSTEIESPIGALTEVTVETAETPALYEVGRFPIQVAASMEAFDAATTSTWFHDPGAQRLHLKVEHVEIEATATVTFEDPAGSPTVAIAGDIACDPNDEDFNDGLGTPDHCRQMATSDLLVGAGHAAVLTLGDMAYECGGAEAFDQSYDPSWGRVKDITRPGIGHHEFDGIDGTDCDPEGDATSYFDYFNGVGNASGPAGDRDKGYYSFDIGSWHIVSLNSICGRAGGCEFGDPQLEWLQADLNASPSLCTLAYMHGPRFSTAEKDSNPDLADLYQALYEGGAEVVVSGHAHNYQRFAPQDPDAELDLQYGLRQFVVGTGGKNIRNGDFLPDVPNWEVWDDTTFGVLEVTLNPTSYDWEFVPEADGVGTFTDSGNQACHPRESGLVDDQAPSAPTDLRAVAVDSGHIEVSWTASSDNVGVVSYIVYRNGAEIATVNGARAFSDTLLMADRGFEYRVRAVDGSGNTSERSAGVVAVTPEAPPTITFTPTADSYIEEGVASNFGGAPTLRTDASPPKSIYLQFSVSGIQAAESAVLRIFAETTNADGLEVRALVDNAWEELTLTDDNAPEPGPVAGTVDLSGGPGYYAVDVSELVLGNGVVSFVLTSSSPSSTRYSSRQGERPPELVVTSGTHPPRFCES